MKFAIRDDDINYFYRGEDLEMWYSDIWNVCPISVSVIPFIKGDWPKNIQLLSKFASNEIPPEVINEILTDKTIYSIGNNINLVNFIKEKVKEHRFDLMIHGIHHRNEDGTLPVIKNNYGIGAEFFTNRDLTIELQEARAYLEKLFNHNFNVFTPPQNKLSTAGLKAVTNNNMAICGDLPKAKSVDTLLRLGLKEYAKFILHKLTSNNIQYSYPILGKRLKLISHYRLQPNTNINVLYRQLEAVSDNDGVFIISTHSYAFDQKMRRNDYSLLDELKKIIDRAITIPSIEFIGISKIFEDE